MGEEGRESFSNGGAQEPIVVPKGGVKAVTNLNNSERAISLDFLRKQTGVVRVSVPSGSSRGVKPPPPRRHRHRVPIALLWRLGTRTRARRRRPSSSLPPSTSSAMPETGRAPLSCLGQSTCREVPCSRHRRHDAVPTASEVRRPHG